MPLFAALESKDPALPNLEIKAYKNLDDLRGILLAGRGDLWLGGVETLARAARLGSPITLLAVTGWRKFYLVSRDPSKHGFEDFAGEELAYAPAAAPVGPLLQGLTTRGLPPLNLVGVEPRQLALMLLDGRRNSAILPEPQVTALLERDPSLRVLDGAAELAGRLTNGPARIPWAGLAAHHRILREHPAQIEHLVAAMIDQSEKLARDPERCVRVLPEEFRAAAGRDLIIKSLTRDLILVKRPLEVRPEIENHLHITAPDLFDRNQRLLVPESFFRRP